MSAKNFKDMVDSMFEYYTDMNLLHVVIRRGVLVYAFVNRPDLAEGFTDDGFPIVPKDLDCSLEVPKTTLDKIYEDLSFLVTELVTVVGRESDIIFYRASTGYIVQTVVSKEPA